MKEKLGLIVPSNLWFCPYVKIYTDLLNKWQVKYDIIFWDRYENHDSNGISYKKKSNNSLISKLIGYYKFSRFIKKQVKKKQYSKLIIFGSQIGIFCSDFLAKYYKKKYLFDFRDLSIEQNKIFKYNFNKLLNNSYKNIISSPGFKKYLPSQYDYIISHNFDINIARNQLKAVKNSLNKEPIHILTIGGIRDFTSNSLLMDSIGNKDNILLSFVGEGIAADSLKKYSIDKSYNNVKFEGYYEKKEEPLYIKNSTFLNIFYPDLLTHKTALSNRFYNAILYRKPMIVNKGQIQGDYCEKYNLGIAVDNIHNLSRQLSEWLDNLNYSEFENNCIFLLEKFILDYNHFEKVLRNFINI